MYGDSREIDKFGPFLVYSGVNVGKIGNIDNSQILDSAHNGLSLSAHKCQSGRLMPICVKAI